MPQFMSAEEVEAKREAVVEPEPEADFEDVNDVQTFDEYTPKFFSDGVAHPDPLVQR